VSLQTEYQVEKEGYEAYSENLSNPYAMNTWAYHAFNRGYQQAMEEYDE
jgi:hypothetical protein